LLSSVASAQPIVQPAVEDAPNPSRIISPCAWYGWDEWDGEGTLLEFNVWVSSPPGAEPEFIGETTDNKFRVCNEEFGTLYEMRVQAVTSAATTVLSDPSIPYNWVHTTDYDDTGGTGFPDFSFFYGQYGTKNNGVQELNP
jgi:hypothetical protein